MNFIEILESVGIFLGLIALGIQIADKLKRIEQEILLNKSIIKELHNHINLHCRAIRHIDKYLGIQFPEYDEIADLKPECKID